MTVAELIERLRQLPQDALVVKTHDHHNQTRQEYIETNDWMQVIDVYQSKGSHGYHWWETRGVDPTDPDFIVKEAVVL